MTDLELPVVKNTNCTKKILSMDEYIEFVRFNLAHTVDREAYVKWKKMLAVNVAFSIDDKQD